MPGGGQAERRKQKMKRRAPSLSPVRQQQLSPGCGRDGDNPYIRSSELGTRTVPFTSISA